MELFVYGGAGQQLLLFNFDKKNLPTYMFLLKSTIFELGRYSYR